MGITVGNKQVASGELVIINDRFGVRIEKVADSSKSYDESGEEYEAAEEEENTENAQEEDFDYSDFEVDGKES